MFIYQCMTILINIFQETCNLTNLHLTLLSNTFKVQIFNSSSILITKLSIYIYIYINACLVSKWLSSQKKKKKSINGYHFLIIYE